MNKNRKAGKRIAALAVGCLVAGCTVTGSAWRSYALQTDEETDAYDAEFEKYLDEQGFPESYRTGLRALHEAHPSWVFQAFHTGLDWSEVIDNEMVFKRNLVIDQKKYPSAYKDTTILGSYDWDNDRWFIISDPYWVQASQEAVEYFMDPRSWFTEEYMFQFELETFNKEVQNLEGVEKILAGTFMSNTYVEGAGENPNAFITSDTYSVSDKYISGIAPGTLVSELIEKLSVTDGELVIYDAKGNIKSPDLKIGTGDIISFVRKKPVETTTEAVESDVSPSDADKESESAEEATESVDYESEASEAYEEQLDPLADEPEDEESNSEPDESEAPEEYETEELSRIEVVILGDISGDGIINAIDRAYLKAQVYGTLSLNDVQKKAADINQDKKFDSLDRAYIKAQVYGTLSINQTLKDNSVTYAQLFLKIGEECNVSPYLLASRVRQEQGVNGTSDLISGKYPGYEGLYNYYNIGAFGTTRQDIIENGLKEARDNGWTSRYLAVQGGARKLCEGHIWKGQDTLYLQKFDVEGEYYGYYWHQYMQNLLVATNEGRNVYRAYRDLGALDEQFVFKIPVYENMPEEACPEPLTDGNPNYKLKLLNIKNYSIDFNRDVYDYYINVPRAVKSLEVSATPIAATTTVTGAGKVTIKSGTSLVTISTEAENGDKVEYRIHLKRT